MSDVDKEYIAHTKTVDDIFNKAFKETFEERKEFYDSLEVERNKKERNYA